ncbi:hypothetical protein EVAR_25464_1 [Eumeta japonica]|uniref:Histone-lysine N-methyltransferase SETMAR n=1 Tax=Eumeta variegata TaxID=151549 RepID=A0A4C1VM11_EUMVA|nr:hypothetical protein EVAR_25464_1 [Eumeta japonica]
MVDRSTWSDSPSEGWEETAGHTPLPVIFGPVFDAKDEPGSGRPVTDKLDTFVEKVDHDRHFSSHDIAAELGIDHKTLLISLKRPRYTKKAQYLGPPRAH